MIYLDYQATTPLAPEAREAMLPWLTAAGSANPHSAHVSGRAAKAAVELAREQVAALLPKGGQVYFTSGATEALNWALIGGSAQRIAASATEHAAVLDTATWLDRRGHDVTLLPVDSDGLIRPDAVPGSLDLLAVMLVNNEIGTVQPVAELAARAGDALVLCDAVQGFGRIAIPDGCDLIAISAHKIHGPKGIGALWVRDGVKLEPLLHGGGQEGGLRSGTLSPALCAGFGAAAALARARMAEDAAHIERLWTAATACLGTDWQINGSVTARYHGNLNIRRDGLDAVRLISGLRDIAFSAGSACASGSGRPSHVLKAIGLTDAEARSSIRLGFGRYTSEAELTGAIDRIVAAADSQARLAA
ncbi:cysteine desulfurase family protein [Sphingomonas sp. SUN039]|uniref:cysteine desulfurase family protein n=1 Tax=Sphingomonas sp. SUN039 TaxID=2937787 RepID=UPI0021648BEE|nr:cysteine desulfurase family protein [Sphingomonas sp. SUN039]UVO53856.1 cysteine desulfurase [Sphingomonas sp. SUN039]